MEKIKIVSIEETNRFADSRKASNGGGYPQPEYVFTFKGVVGTFEDSSCGDFGSRFYVEYDGKRAVWGSMVTRSFTDFTREDEAFKKAFYSTFGVEII